MVEKHTYSKVRMRGYKCLNCQAVTHVYSNDDAPTDCFRCKEKILTLVWDHVIESVKSEV